MKEGKIKDRVNRILGVILMMSTLGRVRITPTNQLQVGRYNFIYRMSARESVMLAIAVFLMFGTLGPASALANSIDQLASWSLLFVITGISGAMAASIVLSMRRPILLLIVVPIFVIATANSERIASFLTGKEELFNPPVTSSVTISREDAEALKKRKMAYYAMSAWMVGLGWGMFSFVLNREAKKRGRIESELEIAAGIQQSLLPREALHLPWIQVTGKALPASEVGGDYFDFVKVNEDQVAIMMADVAGHGVGAGIIASMLKGSLRMQVSVDPSPARLMERLNNVVFEVTDTRTFVTAVYLLVDHRSRRVQLVTAGHPPALHKRASGEVAEVSVANRPLGFMANVTFREIELEYATGDSFLLYTDGLTEAGERAKGFFGVEGVRRAFAEAGKSEAGCDTIIEAARSFANDTQFRDDAAVVMVEMS